MVSSAALIKQACDKIGIKCQPVTKDGVVMLLELKNGFHYTYNFSLGLITNSQSKICHDKAYQYEIFEGTLPLPKTKTFVDPDNIRFKEFATNSSRTEIAKIIMKNLSFPIILKKNRGSEGINIFLANNETEIDRAISKIFNFSSANYDHVLLAQQYIKPQAEYRVIIFQGKIELVYEKLRSKQGTSNLSPLHSPGSKAVKISDQNLIEKMQKIVSELYKAFPINYAGLDIIMDDGGKLWLIEINSDPSYSFFIRDNGEETIINLFSKMFSDLAEGRLDL